MHRDKIVSHIVLSRNSVVQKYAILEKDDGKLLTNNTVLLFCGTALQDLSHPFEDFFSNWTHSNAKWISNGSYKCLRLRENQTKPTDLTIKQLQPFPFIESKDSCFFELNTCQKRTIYIQLREIPL